MRRARLTRSERLRAFLALIAIVTSGLALQIGTAPTAEAAEPYRLVFSKTADRAAPADVSGQTVAGNIYAFTTPATGVSVVRFYIDDPNRSGTPYKVEKGAPYDLAGTAQDQVKTALPFDTRTLSNTVHTITAAITKSNNAVEVLSGTLRVANNVPRLVLDPDGVDATAQPGSVPASIELDLSTSDGVAATYQATDDAQWLSVTPVTGATPADLQLSFDAAGLAPGLYTAAVTVSAPGYVGDRTVVRLLVNRYAILVSWQPNRSSAVPLDGVTTSGDLYVFSSPTTGATKVTFYLDDPAMTGTPYRIEKGAPFDLAGTKGDGTAFPFNASALSAGQHTISAVVDRTDATTEALHARFTVQGAAPAPRPPDQIHLSWVSDPSTTLTALWRTLGANPPSTIEYRRAGDVTWTQVTGARRTSGTQGNLHEATLTGLLPQTSYEYRVLGDGGAWSAISTTRTAPAPGPANFDAVYVADTGLIGRTDGLATGTQPVRDAIASQNPNVVLGGGDYAYFETDKRFTTLDNTIDAWFNQMQPIASRAPLMPTYGNHEVASNLHENYDSWAARFATPTGIEGRRFYSFDVGDAHFTSILATTNSGGLTQAQLNWIDSDLAAARAAGKRWLVPFMHVSAFSDGANHPSNTTLRAQLGPIFEARDVQVVLTSHDQSYERTYPLSGAGSTNTPTTTRLDCYTPSDGVTWVKTSPGGKLSNLNSGFSQWQTTPKPSWTAFRDNTEHHFTRLRFSAAGELLVETYGIMPGGAPHVIDTFRYVTAASCEQALAFDPSSLGFQLTGSASQTKTTTLSSTAGTVASYTLSDNASWLTATPASGSTPAAINVTASANGLAAGTYTGTVTASASGFDPAQLQVTLVVGSSACGPLPCSEALVDIPYELDFDADRGKIPDRDGTGTGFTYVDRPTNGTGYIQDKLDVDTSQGVLRVTSTPGIAFRTTNSQDNALGVGVDPRDQVTVVSARINAPPSGTNFEQAGIWFGNDEDNYAKLVVLNTTDGTVLESHLEVNGSDAGKHRGSIAVVSGSTVDLTLRANPVDRTIRASYALGGGEPIDLGTFVAPPEFFSFDGARIDPTIGTDTFTGILTTHRNGPSAKVYTFDSFAVNGEDLPSGGTTESFPFQRSSYSVPTPTSMTWGPDGRLYVTELMGTIHALSFNSSKQVIADERITTLTTVGARLTLGIAIDPESTPSDVRLWLAHSHPAISNAPPNSSAITKLSGPGFATRQDVITGLPRSKANHAINSLHFGPDGKLYIAAGGNTGAGAPNSGDSEFGDFEEQPLSAALLVADVKASGFDGTCDNAPNLFAPNPCSVQVWASGLRNMYDFTFHANGRMYGPDNGLGVEGTFPPRPTPPCTGFADTRPYEQGGHNPGPQPDELFLLEQGRYYGHPNPHRNECVFRDGSYQNVAPAPNYSAPMVDLGEHKSSNGVIDYRGTAFADSLRGSLLIVNYSVGDDITRVRLSPDGRTVLGTSQIATGFNDPLPIAQDNSGTIFVGELGGNVVTILRPDDNIGTWTTKAPMPQSVLDAGGTALGGKVYSIAGKTSDTAYLSSVRVYDPVANAWSSAAPLPGPAVENPAVVAHDGKLYAFGGSTAPFSGAVTNAAVYDPATNVWTALAPLPLARAGAGVVSLGGRIYVAGGMDSTGASVSRVDRYDPATNTWSTVAAMGTRRDNPGAAALGGKLYVFGGRTRNADGSGTDRLATTEAYDPSTNAWTAQAPMPTARRTMVVGLLGGGAQLIGGEKAADGSAFAHNESYDPVTNQWRTLRPMPTARHGAVAGTITGTVYVVGGGPIGGSSFTNVNEAFTLSP